MNVADMIFIILISAVFVMLAVKLVRDKVSKKQKSCSKCSGCAFSSMCGKKF